MAFSFLIATSFLSNSFSDLDLLTCEHTCQNVKKNFFVFFSWPLSLVWCYIIQKSKGIRILPNKQIKLLNNLEKAQLVWRMRARGLQGSVICSRKFACCKESRDRIANPPKHHYLTPTLDCILPLSLLLTLRLCFLFPDPYIFCKNNLTWILKLRR